MVLLGLAVIGLLVGLVCTFGLACGVGWFLCVAFGRAATWALCKAHDVVGSPIVIVALASTTVVLTSAFAGFLLAVIVL